MPPTAKLDLADDQRFALMKFRRSVADCLLPGHDDFYLLRWLKARSFNPEAAEKMLRESLRWRERWDVDRLGTHWNPPEALAQHFPSGICGVDKENNPIVVLPFGGLDLWGMLHSATKTDFIKMTARTLEKYLGEASRISRELGRPSTNPQLFVVMDMEGFQLRQYTWRPAGEAVLALVHMYEANYPEILKTCVIINAPSVFSVAFAIVRPFLHENTVRKIQIYGASPRKWKPVLLQSIDSDQLPQHYGGTMLGAGGDPKCSDKILVGGKVPKSMYFKDTVKNGEGDAWTTACVKKKEKLHLNFPVPPEQSGWYLKWEFCSDQSDIQFAVYKSHGGDQLTPVMESRRVSSSTKSSPEVGLTLCEEPANYVVEFENDSSLRSKKVHYQIVLAPPLSAGVDDLAEQISTVAVA